LWNVKLNRYANIKEKLKLQSFPEDFNIVVSKTQLNKQLGNSISVNVLKEIIIQLLM
jgi:site-specific DNA-cytosine methylase